MGACFVKRLFLDDALSGVGGVLVLLGEENRCSVQ